MPPSVNSSVTGSSPLSVSAAPTAMVSELPPDERLHLERLDEAVVELAAERIVGIHVARGEERAVRRQRDGVPCVEKRSELVRRVRRPLELGQRGNSGVDRGLVPAVAQAESQLRGACRS